MTRFLPINNLFGCDVQLSVMNNAAFMEGSVTMEFVNFAALTMQATLVRTAPNLFLVFQSAMMC